MKVKRRSPGTSSSIAAVVLSSSLADAGNCLVMMSPVFVFYYFLNNFLLS